MNPAEGVFLDAVLFIGAPLARDARHAETLGLVEAARRGELAGCACVGVLAEDLWPLRSTDWASIHATRIKLANP